MDFWPHDKNYIGIDAAYEDFLKGRADYLSLLNQRPENHGPKFDKWWEKFGPVEARTKKTFMAPFESGERIALAIKDEREFVIPPEYWGVGFADLTLAGDLMTLGLDYNSREYEGCRVVLRKTQWENWIGRETSEKTRQGSIGAQTKCLNWLVQMMSKNSAPEQLKKYYRNNAKETFSVSGRSFDVAWATAIKQTGNTNWNKPGPRPKSVL